MELFQGYSVCKASHLPSEHVEISVVEMTFTGDLETLIPQALC